MAGATGKTGSSGGGASNAALQDDEDTLNRKWRGKHFRDWAATRKSKRQHGSLIVYDKSPAPPKK